MTRPTLEEHPLAPDVPHGRAYVEWRAALGTGLFVLAALVVVFTWYRISREVLPAKQMPYLASGGFGALVLAALGVTCFVSLEHAHDREALHSVMQRVERLEATLEVEAVESPPAPVRKVGAPRRTKAAG